MNEVKKIIKNHPQITILALGALVVLVVAVLFAVISESNKPEKKDRNLVRDESGQMVQRAALSESGEKIQYTFNCPEAKSFSTSYDLGSNALTLTLSPDVSYVLQQDVSKFGGRYSSADNQVVFLENKGEAQVKINGEVKYQDCVAAQTASSTPGV